MASRLTHLFRQLSLSGPLARSCVQPKVISLCKRQPLCIVAQGRSMSVLNAQAVTRTNQCSSSNQQSSILAAFNKRLLVPTPTPFAQSVRTRTQYSRNKGKPRTVKAVVTRFFRLNSGMWIRARAGRNKRLWMKSNPRVKRLQEHWIVNGQQARMLDKMVNYPYRAPKYFENDPYKHYHKRENLPIFNYSKKPFYP